eukprot:g2551.t1
MKKYKYQSHRRLSRIRREMHNHAVQTKTVYSGCVNKFGPLSLADFASGLQTMNLKPYLTPTSEETKLLFNYFKVHSNIEVSPGKFSPSHRSTPRSGSFGGTPVRARRRRTKTPFVLTWKTVQTILESEHGRVSTIRAMLPFKQKNEASRREASIKAENALIAAQVASSIRQLNLISAPISSEPIVEAIDAACKKIHPRKRDSAAGADEYTPLYLWFHHNWRKLDCNARATVRTYVSAVELAKSKKEEDSTSSWIMGEDYFRLLTDLKASGYSDKRGGNIIESLLADLGDPFEKSRERKVSGKKMQWAIFCVIGENWSEVRPMNLLVGPCLFELKKFTTNYKTMLSADAKAKWRTFHVVATRRVSRGFHDFTHAVWSRLVIAIKRAGGYRDEGSGYALEELCKWLGKDRNNGKKVGLMQMQLALLSAIFPRQLNETVETFHQSRRKFFTCLESNHLNFAFDFDYSTIDIIASSKRLFDDFNAFIKTHLRRIGNEVLDFWKHFTENVSKLEFKGRNRIELLKRLFCMKRKNRNKHKLLSSTSSGGGVGKQQKGRQEVKVKYPVKLEKKQPIKLKKQAKFEKRRKESQKKQIDSISFLQKVSQRRQSVEQKHIHALSCLYLFDNLSPQSKIEITSYQLNNFNSQEALALAVKATEPNLTDLQLNCNNLGDEGLGLLVKLGLHGNSSLIGLKIRNNGITMKGISKLCIFLREKSCKLQVLHLCDNNIGKRGCIELSAALRRNHFISDLSLHKNEIGDDGVVALSESFVYAEKIRAASGARKKIKKLDISFNNISDEGAKGIAASLHMIESLNISQNEITSIGASHISRAILNGSERFFHLKILDISHNPIGSRGASFLFATSRRKIKVEGLGRALGMRMGSPIGLPPSIDIPPPPPQEFKV